MSFLFEMLWPAKKLQFSLINVTYFFIFVTNFHSHLLDYLFKQCSSFDKLDQLFISFKMIYNMTIFGKKFFELPKIKGRYLPLPYENPSV